MGGDETLVDIVERMERAVRRLETLVDGDPDIPVLGLKQQLQQLRVEVDELKATRPNVPLWILGFATFVMAFAMADDDFRRLAELTTPVAWAIGTILLVVSCVLLMSGFGWVRWTR